MQVNTTCASSWCHSHVIARSQHVQPTSHHPAPTVLPPLLSSIPRTLVWRGTTRTSHFRTEHPISKSLPLISNESVYRFCSLQNLSGCWKPYEFWLNTSPHTYKACSFLNVLFIIFFIFLFFHFTSQSKLLPRPALFLAPPSHFTPLLPLLPISLEKRRPTMDINQNNHADQATARLGCFLFPWV